jgi:hypothetical protein
MEENKDDSKTELSDIEKAEQLIRERDEKNFAEYLTELNALNAKFGYEPYVPEIQQPRIQIRRIINA